VPAARTYASVVAAATPTAGSRVRIGPRVCQALLFMCSGFRRRCVRQRNLM